ncbi:MAG: SusC/RagA family TonB-linked outer membrane protein [Bacteroidetes bacterium]|nr:SusC/RagA family TonB-linked outer membrane protein [Bacteroidota bacterium]
MIKKLLPICGILLLIPLSNILAQDGTMTGTVTDFRTGDPIPGVNIFIPDIKRGTSTNTDGEYSIENLETGSYQVRITFIGYKSKTAEVDVGIGTTVADFILEEDLIGLEDIVVTAQQIEREERELGYSVTSVSSEELTVARDPNLINSLSGKAPGVHISNQSGTVGGSTRIVIRGNTTLNGNTQPLFVVDGVPIYNSNIVNNTSSATRLSGGAVDVGNRGSDINADDIESITVLKGAAAAALYGQRAQNGVILITTKKGTAGGTNVTVNSTVRTSSPLRLPNYQNEFASGDYNAETGEYEFDATDFDGWGPRIEGQTVTDYRGEEVQLQSYPNNVQNFFENGMESIQSISLASGDENSDFRLGVTNTNQEGIIPSSHLNRTNVSFNGGRKINDDLRARMSVNYSFSETEGRAIQGGNSPNTIISTVMYLPRNIDLSIIKNNVLDPETGDQIPLASMTNNPYFITRNNGLNNDVERIFGTGTVVYSPLEWLNVTARVGTDFYTENRLRINAVGTIGREDGGFFTDRIQERQINSDLLININRALSEDLSLKATLGQNVNIRKQQIFSNSSVSLAVPGLNNFSNAQSNSPTNNLQERRLLAVYGDATLGFRNYLFLTLTGRNDWSSTLPLDNRSFFYPSANLSFIFTEAFNMSSSVLSYGKVRANVAEVGSDEAPYQLAFRYFPDASAFGQYGTTILFPFDGRLAFDATNTIPPSNLKPQRQRSFELGTELQFFDGRVGLDFTYYDSETRDQIISIPRPISTGFSARRANVGTLTNRGFEALLSVSPVRTRSFQWNSTFNFSRNIQEVEKLAKGVEEITINSGFNGLRVKAVPGDELALYGTGWARNDAGEILIDGSTGLRIPGDERRLGAMDPEFTLGINNSITFKNIHLSFLVDIKKGGTVVSGTVQGLQSAGLTKEAGDLRNEVGDAEFIDPVGVIENEDGSYRKNDVQVESIQAYYNNLYQPSVWEEVAYDASYVKLREINVGYSLPRRWLENTPLGEARVSFEARNLWLIWAEAPHIDPETNVFGSGVIGQGVEFNNIPNQKSYGMNVKLTF